jgi:hypothetical protein
LRWILSFFILLQEVILKLVLKKIEDMEVKFGEKLKLAILYLKS